MRGRAQHRVSQPTRCLLADGVDLGESGGRADALQTGRVALTFQGGLQFDLPVKMVFYCLLGTTRDKKDVSQSGAGSFLHHILDSRPVNDRQHLLGKGLGRWQESGAQPRSRNHRLRY